MNPTASELYKQFQLIEANYPKLKEACHNDPNLLKQLEDKYNTAKLNYNKAINKEFNYDDKKVLGLQNQLVNEGQQLSNALTDLTSISQTLNTIASVVSFGESVISAV